MNKRRLAIIVIVIGTAVIAGSTLPYAWAQTPTRTGQHGQMGKMNMKHSMPLAHSVGLINSMRGAHGGYKLARAPSQITLRQVVQALEGPLFVVECVNAPSVCERVGFCITRDIWKELGEKISETLESVTLEDMVDMQKNKGRDSLIYNI